MTIKTSSVGFFSWVVGVALLGAACELAAPTNPPTQSLERTAHIALALPAAAAKTTVGDAYANQGANLCSWTIGTAGIEKVLTFSSSSKTYLLTSFKNKLPNTVREYVQAASTSTEFRFTWDGTTYSGATGGWTCTAGTAYSTTVGGSAAIQLDVTLNRSAIRVTKHYIIFPSESLIREWTEYTNTDSIGHTLSQPSFLEQNLMSQDAGNTDLNYITGAAFPDDGYSTPSWTLRTHTLANSYSRSFDSYDVFSCDGPSCNQQGAPLNSEIYIPWFGLWNRVNKDGVYAGFDYYGRWQAPLGNQNNNQISLSLHIPNYSKALATNETMTSPKAFAGVYVTDLDDMTNRLLDWQYRYMWDYTRADYFTAIRMLGSWRNGAQAPLGTGWDNVGTLQKVFDLTDHMRTIGADTYHRDFGWWDRIGDWNGPDWLVSKNYLAKHGMKQLIYYFAYKADSASQVVLAHPDWFVNTCWNGPPEQLIDLSIPAALQWMKTLLVTNATAWGDYQWRNDSCFMAAVGGAAQLAQDVGFRQAQAYFLDQRPASAIQGVDGGGKAITYEFLRMSSGFSFTDKNGFNEQYDASRIFPVDKLSGIPDEWNPANCSAKYNALLMFNPDFAGDTLDTDASELECMRQLVGTYHYLVSRGVAGRWVRQYHPHGTDKDSNWFERLSLDGTRGLVIYKGDGSSTAVTVYPKGLNAATSYDVRYQFRAGSASRTGSDLMANGITFSTIAGGELIYLGLPGHPGAYTDTTPPSAPTGLTVSAAVNMNYPGVEVKWNAATDNNWLSYYEVFRYGQSPGYGLSLGKVSKGTYFFDHSPAADVNAVYGVRSVDGDGNVSAMASSNSVAGVVGITDDAPGAGIVYFGTWFHDTTSHLEAYNRSISWSNEANSYAEYTFTGNQITWYTKLGPNCGIANISIDGVLDATVDTYAPDDNNWDIPLYSRSFAAVGRHTVRIAVAGSRNSLSSDNYIYVDGLQALTTPASVFEDTNPAIIYGGTGWQHNSGTFTSASNADVSWDHNAGDSAQLTFSGNEVTWISKLGPNCGEADVYVDGIFDCRVDTYGDRGATVWQSPVYHKTWSTNGTHAIKVVVLGKKNFISTDAWVHVDSFQVRSSSNLVVANDSVLSYSPIWSGSSTNSTYVDSDAHFSNAVGNSASYSFVGTAVQVLGDRDTNHGFGDVAIDGAYEGRFEAYFNYTTGDTKALWEKDGLASGWHTIQLSVVGAHNSVASDNYVTLDAIKYWGSGGLPLFANQANDSAAAYAGSWSSGSVNSTYVSGDAHWSNVAGSGWSFSFYGGSVQILSDRHPNHGCADVTIDGVYRGRYDGYYDSGTGGKQVVWEISGLTVGNHIIQVTVVGNHNAGATDSYVVLDALNYQ